MHKEYPEIPSAPSAGDCPGEERKEYPDIGDLLSALRDTEALLDEMLCIKGLVHVDYVEPLTKLHTIIKDVLFDALDPPTSENHADELPDAETLHGDTPDY